MRKVLALGAAVLIVGSVSVAAAQERLQQSSGGSSLGVGTGVGGMVGVCVGSPHFSGGMVPLVAPSGGVATVHDTPAVADIGVE